jgi:ABC-2 type transport system ATP-binding protein
MNAIEITDFWKKYGITAAVRGISLSIRQGELFGLIGPDGAGKTTTMRAICTLLVPDRGTILVQGLNAAADLVSVRTVLGYMPQRFSLYQDLSVEQNLRFFADLFQVPSAERTARAEELYRFSRLGEFKKRKAAALSGGMKQKLALSCALIHTPQVLVLDEPTTGVDPVSRQEFWDILHSIQKQGTTIFVSTAYLDEADNCDTVALMYSGRIMLAGKPSEVRDSFPYPLYRVSGTNTRLLQEFFTGVPETRTTQLFGDALHVVFNVDPPGQRWNEWQAQTRGNLQAWSKHPPSIEDVFMDLIEGQAAGRDGETLTLGDGRAPR